ncbi:MAG: Fe-S cluster assembly protein SufB [Thermotogota bacterium]|nr:Fe-S cluster assembly protein SufB [Thermotogota bacterium]
MTDLEKNEDRFDIKVNVKYRKRTAPGLGPAIIREISESKEEPEWMLEHRLKCLEIFQTWHDPRFGVDVSDLDLGNIVAYLRPDVDKARSWEDVPEEIREAFEKLGIPEAERKVLAGVGAQYDSEAVYQSIKRELESLGVIFLDMESAVRQYPELVKEYFMQIVKPTLHKYAALHGAVWSGGSFVYVPRGVKVPLPLQGYFMMGSPGSGQFEHTLIIAEEGSEVSYIEGCSAPRYNVLNLHAGMVEILVKPGAKVKYVTIQNWSKNTYNLNTKVAVVEEDGTMEWVSGSFGSMKTMLYPASILKGAGASASFLSITYAGKGQHLDTGAKMIHTAPNTSSVVDARSISAGGGWAFYRGLLHIAREARGSKASVRCSSLMLDNESRADTLPIIEVLNDEADVGHEARIGRISEEQIYYLMARGLSEAQARELIVRGFFEPIAKELPIEYAVELNRLIALELESSIG